MCVSRHPSLVSQCLKSSSTILRPGGQTILGVLITGKSGKHPIRHHFSYLSPLHAQPAHATRYTLNYKRLPYTTEWIELSEIESRCKQLGIAPTGVKPDGTPLYTLPAIWDPATQKTISDSLKIAEYLDKTYPDTPPVTFDGIDQYSHIMAPDTIPEMRSIGRVIFTAICDNLNSASRAHFLRRHGHKISRGQDSKRSRERQMYEGNTQKDEEFREWEQIGKAFDIIDGWLHENGGPFARGEQVSFVDFALAGYIIWIRCLMGEDSWLWQKIMDKNDGRWRAFIAGLEKYEKSTEQGFHITAS
ncbi:hypothetical protein AMATHDRAFT_5715 [Amanita thiersii Skay4041]|uniref:GST N-terminal domain-containing protein n=1 Tax=Amanita thiersii Skay4041 TaxID=703135 RepID=A0A2A9NBW7_9AGAR|nr:hypothetical protein AMATHDRAFT_5715 [Amanita thiersii Skay4041]